MGLPFKNGFELAKAMGFGKMYQASKEKKEGEMMEGKKIIRMTESDLHNIIKESVKKILREGIDTDYYLQDAIEALEMSDCGIDFYEWYDAFQDELDVDEAERIFNMALKQCMC